MKKIMLVLILVVITMGLYAQLVQEEAKNIQGRIEYWDYSSNPPILRPVPKDTPVKVTLTNRPINGNNELDRYAYVTTFNDLGDYNHNFSDPYNNHLYFNTVLVEVWGRVYATSYDGIERLDIIIDQAF
ncbi:MAG: hypothetical protein PHY08_01370 [Candidatus Cloacimonetes bacterium]|nr:hypothetical protein [Candidatus Cloacimonadota bacterium]